MKKATITLSDNTIYHGSFPRLNFAKRNLGGGVFYPVRSKPPQAAVAAPNGEATSNGIYGEVVFNTGMTGYIESLTDPSYSGQILVFTYPLIGNYGVQDKTVWESDRIHAAGVVVSEASESFAEWLHQQNVPLITGVDTRALTKHIRSYGTMTGEIRSTKSETLNKFQIPKFKIVSIKTPKIYNEQFKKTIIAVDCGMKESIIRSLMKLPYRIKRVPYDYDYTGEDYEGAVLSNGPGDPLDYKKTVEITKKVFKKNKPVFGICLGTQIMALAAGAKTYKLKFGHRGHNQPVIEAKSEKRKAKNCFITSQNHGYAVDEKTLPSDWYVNFRNLNDNSVEGIAHKIKPFFAVQFHPEACPGPTDTEFLFEKFHELL